MQTKYAVVEHYPDGNSSAVVLCKTEQEAQEWIRLRYAEDTCTIKKVQTKTIR